MKHCKLSDKMIEKTTRNTQKITTQQKIFFVNENKTTNRVRMPRFTSANSPIPNTTIDKTKNNN